MRVEKKYFYKEIIYKSLSGFVNSSVRLYSLRERCDPTLNCIIMKIQTPEAKETRDTLLASIKKGVLLMSHYVYDVKF